MPAPALRSGNSAAATLTLFPPRCLECRRATRGMAMCKSCRRRPRICARHGIAVLCRGCGEPRVCRPRGLCWSCARNPLVLASVPAEPKRDGAHAVPDQPATAAPSRPIPSGASKPQRLAMLRWRARHGQQLHHPSDDNRLLARIMGLMFTEGEL